MPSLIVHFTPPTRSAFPVWSFSLQRAGAVEHLQVLDRVLIDDHHVGQQRPGATTPNSICVPFGLKSVSAA